MPEQLALVPFSQLGAVPNPEMPLSLQLQELAGIDMDRLSIDMRRMREVYSIVGIGSLTVEATKVDMPSRSVMSMRESLSPLQRLARVGTDVVTQGQDNPSPSAPIHMAIDKRPYERTYNEEYRRLAGNQRDPRPDLTRPWGLHMSVCIGEGLVGLGARRALGGYAPGGPLKAVQLSMIAMQPGIIFYDGKVISTADLRNMPAPGYFKYFGWGQ